jgi:NAD(P)-dependent dehydrogenase (short-subunit alcohol dehydrogenase family)
MTALAETVCMITGAAQGLGAAVARAMALEGAQVVLLDRQSAVLEATCDGIAGGGGRAEAHVLDVTDEDRFAEVVSSVIGRHGRIDVLVNNAAIQPPALSILDDTMENWGRTLRINLDGVYIGSRLVAPHMVAAGRGRIIHIASVQGFVSSGRCGSYNAAKGAVLALTKSMAVELGPHGILVNAVAPGFMVTPMSVVDGVDETTTPEFREWYVERGRIPLRRAGLPEEVAGTVLFLASPLCRYMTGQKVLVMPPSTTSIWPVM